MPVTRNTLGNYLLSVASYNRTRVNGAREWLAGLLRSSLAGQTMRRSNCQRSDVKSMGETEYLYSCQIGQDLIEQRGLWHH